MNTPLLRRAINACLFNGTSADAGRLASFAARENADDSLRAEALATLSVWPDPSTLDRVTGRHRGTIQNAGDDAVDALRPVINPLLSGDSDMTKVALTKAISDLGKQKAEPERIALIG